MKRLSIAVLFLLITCLGCAGGQTVPAHPQSGLDCQSCFARWPWRAVHRIQADFYPTGSLSLIGVSQGDPLSRDLSTVLMTAEGFVLLECKRSHGKLKVLRALPPFDKPAMVQGLLADVVLMFLPPNGKPSKTAGGCFWELTDGSRLGVERQDDGGCRLRLWNELDVLTRQVHMTAPWHNGFAEDLELKASGEVSYRIVLRLIEAETLVAKH